MAADQTRWLVGLGGALVVVAGVLVVSGEPDPVDPEGDDVPLWQVASDTVVAVRVDRELPERGDRVHRDLAFARGAAGWTMTEPLATAADEDALRALLRLVEARQGEVVEGALEPEEYGLGDPPLARVIVRTESGLERELWVGAKVPTGFRTYARLPDGPVVTIAGDGHRVISERAEAFRDHRMFSVDPAQVRQVELFGPEGRLVLRGQGRHWSLQDWGRAASGSVDDVVMGLLDLRYDLIWEQNTWIDAPSYGAILTEESGTSYRLHVGEETPMGLVASTSDGRYGVMFPDLAKQLGRGPTSVLDPAALPLDMEHAVEVKVVLAGRARAARRNGPDWSIPGVDDAAAFGRVRALSEAAAIYRRDAPSGPFEQGSIEVVEGDHVHRLRLGTVTDGLRAIIDDGHPWAYRMAEQDLQAFLAPE